MTYQSKGITTNYDEGNLTVLRFLDFSYGQFHFESLISALVCHDWNGPYWTKYCHWYLHVPDLDGISIACSRSYVFCWRLKPLMKFFEGEDHFEIEDSVDVEDCVGWRRWKYRIPLLFQVLFVKFGRYLIVQSVWSKAWWWWTSWWITCILPPFCQMEYGIMQFEHDDSWFGRVNVDDGEEVVGSHDLK